MIPLLKLNLVDVKCLMDLKKIQDLSSISIAKEDGSEIEVGALVRHSEIADSELLWKSVPLLSMTAAGIGHPLVRNRGTIGGSLCHCDPAADYPPTLLNLEAKLSLVSRNSKRRIVSASDFFRGPFETSLERGELLEKIIIPSPRKGSTYAFKKFKLGHSDFPLVVVSVLANFRGESDSIKCEAVAISLAGVAEKAFRATEAEEYLLNRTSLDVDSDFKTAAEITRSLSRPESDIDVSSEYKRRLVGVLTRRTLEESYSKWKKPKQTSWSC